MVAAVLLLSAGQAVFRPALQAVIPALVTDREELPVANALFEMTDRIARLIGPAIMGLLVLLIPIQHFFTLDAVGFMVSAAALLRMRRLAPSAVLSPLPRASRLGTVVHGFRIVFRHRTLSGVLVAAGVVDGAWYAVMFLALPLAISQHATSQEGLGIYGVLISAYGMSNLLATIALGSLKALKIPLHAISGGMILGGIGFVILGILQTVGLSQGSIIPALGLALMISAPGGALQNIPLSVMRQTELSRADLPAAMRAFLFSSNLGTLAAMLIAPIIYLRFPLWTGIVGSGFAMMCCGLFTLWFRWLRGREAD